MKISALLSHGSGAGELVAAELDDPRSDEVIVRIEAVGVCHTDLVTRQALGNRPAVLGHEGCGIVERWRQHRVELESGVGGAEAFGDFGGGREGGGGREQGGAGEDGGFHGELTAGNAKGLVAAGRGAHFSASHQVPRKLRGGPSRVLVGAVRAWPGRMKVGSAR